MVQTIQSRTAEAGALLEFERVDRCYLCDSAEQHDARGVSWKGVAFSYCYCGGCGLKYMRPRPTAASYQRFYRDGFWQQKMTASGYATMQGFDDANQDQMAIRMKKYRRGYQLVKRHLSEAIHLGHGVRVLEVGCAFGYTLEWLREETGCDVFGIEPSTEARARLEQARIPVVGATAEERLAGVSAPSPAKRFHAIVFCHSLENIVDPRPVLEGACAHLANGGVILIYTPNVEFFDSMNPYHPYVYSPQTLGRLLNQAGLYADRVDAPLSPDRNTALRTVAPSHEVGCIARPGRVVRTPAKPVDVVQLVQSHHWGQRALIWAELRPRDLATRALAMGKLRARRLRDRGRS
ncbi:MAG TPA: class I SAM-dependent methyltransferase [Methylomirabilota bacterium]|jgi:SAM-dependent methyltransferase|nr:class I SAM-dependent methyltransferase [Methylomirabilota bacterium]